MRKVLILFGVLEDRDVEWLASIGQLVDLEAGTAVILEDRESASVFVLLSGSCSVRAAAVRGQEIARLFPGEVFGEMSFIDSRPPSASVTTLERSQLLSIPKDLLSERLRVDTAFAARFYQALAIFLGSRLRTTVARLGYAGKTGEPPALDDSDDLDPAAMERISAAGRRFNNLQRRVFAAGAEQL